MSFKNEQEEFEFRLRLEHEQKAEKPQEQEEGWGRWAGRQALSAVPAVGAVVGGALGAPGGGAGAIPGAALGYGAGKQIERLGKQYLLGDTEDTVPTNPLDQATQAAGDISEGVVAEVGGQALSKVISPVGQYIANRMKKTGIDAAARHLRPTPNVSRALGQDGVNEVAEEALRAGAIKPGAKTASTAQRLRDLTDEVGAVKGDIVQNSPATIEPAKLHADINRKVVQPLQSTTAGKRIAQPIQERADALVADLGPGPVPASRIEAEKMMEQGDINYLSPSSKAKMGADKDYARTLKESVEEAMGNDPAFLASKKSYGNLKQGRDMAERTAGLTDNGGGLMGHITDTGVMMEGIEGAATQNPIKMAAPVARALTKGRVASTVAAGSYGAGNALENATKQYANPVSRAIAARMASQNRTPKDRPTLRQEHLDQQTDQATQEEFRKSQE